jgi:Mce-associated membrane protein
VLAGEVEELSANGPTAGTTEVKASRSRATASGAARARAKRNGSVLGAQEIEELSSNGQAAAAEATAVELPEIQSADHEELPPGPLADGSRQETTSRRAPRRIAVRSWVGSNLLLSCLAVALVVAVALLTLAKLSLNSESSLNGARTSALAAAKIYAVDLASYNYKHLNQDFGKVLAESTPTFKESFSQSSEALKATLSRYDASARAHVVAAGLVSVTTSRAVALVFLNQTVDNSIQKNKPTTESRVEVTLLRSGGRWLIDQVSLL